MTADAVELQHRVEAQALAVALELGLVQVSDVVDWGIARVAEVSRPHWSLCEVACAGTMIEQDLVNLLREIPGTAPAEIVRARVLCMIAEQFRPELPVARRVASALHQLAMVDEIPDAGLKALSWWAWDALDLAIDGTILETPEEIMKEMSAALAAYADRVCARRQRPA